VAAQANPRGTEAKEKVDDRAREQALRCCVGKVGSELAGGEASAEPVIHFLGY